MEKQETPAPQQTDLASIIVEKDFEDAFNEFVTFAESVQGVDPAWESFLNYTPKDPTKDHLKIWRQLDKESGLYKYEFLTYFQLLYQNPNKNYRFRIDSFCTILAFILNCKNRNWFN
jgi:hypothetical protein